ncbi:ring-1,2-phenylacetyl-CoA epoxidase subunit PaaE [Mucilaginibacter lappiensis]|uniref:Ring-1,2-phenylacetyl-CoA epoxidase subunit PaaE n=1 Tax=Mucilaginibacter lappiensis TaxID=354630 RepID=A0ABR6PM25_9SPHI|nr:FAD-binding oxidoreductase [Mucilaginibacter lappiensis]MBB6110785.1 ring-1,2-phenylacetyl-CoA epoxidase subunit PaaE [Mucilaginibacter lappiensis]SIR63769.1 ring-1,2-phenylacetyl-CoA epoxidase subunit PaaE [Mucilaginibacter lappiensis]
MLIYTLKIIELRYETVDTLTICFKQPGLKKVKYLAGQYLTLIFRINGRRYIRPYSFSSAPGIDSNIEVTVKRVTGGIVSNHIHDKLSVGDIVEVFEPLGDFTLDKVTNLANSHLVLWGAGSGVTPLMSIAKFVLHNGLCNHLTLVYGNKSFESVIFSNQINELKKTFKNLSLFHFYSKLTISATNSNIIEGRIDPKKILSVMKSERPLENTVHYICGPTGLKESVKDQLYKLGIIDENIYTEDFEIVRDPKEFELILTQNVEIIMGNSNQNIEVVKGKSILEAGLDASLELSYSCQTGSCLICKGKLLSGEVKMIGAHKKNELLPDECLLCCSFPVTNNVKVLVTD